MGYCLCYVHQMKGSCKIDISIGFQVSDRVRINDSVIFSYSYTQHIQYKIFMFKLNMEKLYA